MSFVRDLDRFSAYISAAKLPINHATVDVTERYARKKLRIKKDDPLTYRGLSLTCRGSKKWRYENDRRFGQPHYGHDSR